MFFLSQGSMKFVFVEPSTVFIPDVVSRGMFAFLYSEVLLL